MTQVPPSRYKVVERGRRLVVIDSRTGQPTAREPQPGDAAPTMPAQRDAPRPVERDTAPRVDDRSGSAIFTTSRLYDLKGPRRIVMTDAVGNALSRAAAKWAVGIVAFIVVAMILPFLWVLPVVGLFQPKIRAALRQRTTRLIDEAAQVAG